MVLIKDVEVGQQVWTKVSGERVAVEVVRVVRKVLFPSSRVQRRVIVKRLDTGNILPKPRPASALHTTGGPWYSSNSASEARVRAEFSRLKATEEIDAWGMSRAARTVPLTAERVLKQLVKEGRAVRDGNWYGPTRKGKKR